MEFFNVPVISCILISKKVLDGLEIFNSFFNVQMLITHTPAQRNHTNGHPNLRKKSQRDTLRSSPLAEGSDFEISCSRCVVVSNRFWRRAMVLLFLERSSLCPWAAFENRRILKVVKDKLQKKQSPILYGIRVIHINERNFFLLNKTYQIIHCKQSKSFSKATFMSLYSCDTLDSMLLVSFTRHMYYAF